MTATLAIAFIIPVIGGSLLLCVFWPRERGLRGDLPLILALGAGLGLGLSSAGFFIGLVGFGSSKAFFALEAMGLAVLLGLALRRVRSEALTGPRRPVGHPTGAPFVSWLLAPAFAGSLIAALVRFGYRSATYPHGAWDATTIWNLRARFLFRGADHWRDAFSNLLGTWAHADYPLLVPGAVARAWSFIGSEPQAVPILLGLVFTLATALLLWGALTSLRSRGQGLLAGVVLLCCNSLVYQGANQYADVPLAFFMLGSFVALALADTVKEGGDGLVVLAGLTAGLAAWTKNEGLLFVLALFVARLLVIARLRGGRQALRCQGVMVLGLAPMLLLICAFKWGIAPANDLLASLQPTDILDRLTNPWRLWFVLHSFGERFLALSGWLAAAPLALALYLLVVGWRKEGVERESLGTMLVTLGLVLAAYIFVYVVTPYDLAWHVATSMHRLALHCWPSLLFAYFLIVRNPEAAVTEL
ncbi:MAG: phospholipid carrier-dependent glycosyltransferase, partial [Gemmatimonadetes bacterium]|nr:phospholipid carrier-dependent glycosyltransferase [Gemmatimonadota bacterium]NIO30582.1 phospholipid carrier-dependent glycosyltransferase [Gemmatimonadota bacterium]